MLDSVTIEEPGGEQEYQDIYEDIEEECGRYYTRYGGYKETQDDRMLWRDKVELRHYKGYLTVQYL